MLLKYASQESMVDNFVAKLLDAIGFNEGFLFVVPQFSMDLKFDTIRKEAKADFVIQDVLSFYKLFIIEDKSKKNEIVNSEPQMIAEAIANFQMNEVLQETIVVPPSEESANTATVVERDVLEELFGLRVNGHKFWFYRIPITPSIINCMRYTTATTAQNEVKRVGMTNGLDFFTPNDRVQIIKLLDNMKSVDSIFRSGRADRSCGSSTYPNS
jgi:hypothetical protein